MASTGPDRTVRAYFIPSAAHTKPGRAKFNTRGVEGEIRGSKFSPRRLSLTGVGAWGATSGARAGQGERHEGRAQEGSALAHPRTYWRIRRWRRRTRNKGSRFGSKRSKPKRGNSSKSMIGSRRNSRKSDAGRPSFKTSSEHSTTSVTVTPTEVLHCCKRCQLEFAVGVALSWHSPGAHQRGPLDARQVLGLLAQHGRG